MHRPPFWQGFSRQSSVINLIISAFSFELKTGSVEEKNSNNHKGDLNLITFWLKKHIPGKMTSQFVQSINNEIATNMKTNTL